MDLNLQSTRNELNQRDKMRLEFSHLHKFVDITGGNERTGDEGPFFQGIISDEKDGIWFQPDGGNWDYSRDDIRRILAEMDELHYQNKISKM